MTITMTVDSDVVSVARTDYRTKATLSTARVKFFVTTQKAMSGWYSSSARLWLDDQAAREGYESMGPLNYELVKEFAPKVRKGWPDW